LRVFSCKINIKSIRWWKCWFWVTFPSHEKIMKRQILMGSFFSSSHIAEQSFLDWNRTTNRFKCFTLDRICNRRISGIYFHNFLTNTKRILFLFFQCKLGNLLFSYFLSSQFSKTKNNVLLKFCSWSKNECKCWLKNLKLYRALNKSLIFTLWIEANLNFKIIKSHNCFFVLYV
jgi:hypothetical protein